MVKLFLAGVIGCILIAFGVIAAVVTPLAPGVQQNLQNAPASPFRVPPFIMDAIHSVFSAASPEVVLFATLAIGAMLVVYTLATLLSLTVGRIRQRQAILAQLRREGRLNALRMSGQVGGASTTAGSGDLENLWK